MSDQSAARKMEQLLRSGHEPLAEALGEELRKLRADESALAEKVGQGGNEDAVRALYEIRQKARVLENGIRSVKHG